MTDAPMSRDQRTPAEAAESDSLPKAYDPHQIEQALYRRWEQAGYFAPRGTGRPYCIMLPPPNVTGSLHMGHAFQDTLMDALIRYRRMKGDRVLWQGGTDHAGIATQMVVERQLEAEGKTRHDLGREAFVARVWQWKAQSGDTITHQMRRLGCSIDWSRSRFTMDEGLSRAVVEVFVRLYEEGLIYRGKRLVNWDPVLRTAISDLEVISEEESGHLWHIRYPLDGGGGHLVVATTRPETLLGDTAVAVHPDDERYAQLIGKLVELPLTGRKIPVIADESVERDFGSGCVKITPAHDFNDYEVGKRHGLALLNIFTPDARINLPGSPYHGLDRFEARRRIVADLEAAGLLEKTELHRLMVPRGDRSHAVIEPYLTDQWYVKVGPLAKAAIEAVEDGRIRFVPENWAKTYFEWMRNIQDWCISRQIWWGHRIPAWYDEDGNVFVARSEAEARAQARAKQGREVPLVQDEDVLDTWFSSALWPFSTLGWPEQTAELKTFYPTSVLVTGFDIIFFWVARMIMMGLKFAGDVPFREVYIHGLVRDAHGQKMSKSKGNILDPLDLIDGIDLERLVKKRTTGLMRPQDAPRIEQATRREFPRGIPAFGTDALRFTFASLATQGRDIKFDLGRIEGYRNFCNKLWNAARFVLLHTEGRGEAAAVLADGALEAVDRWILRRLDRTIEAVEAALREYRFDLAAQAAYQFAWHEYCDWYIEFAKVVLNDPTASPPARLHGTRHTLLVVLEALLRLLHPLMPFITEALWQRIAPLAGRQGETIMLAPYPEPTFAAAGDDSVSEEIEWLMAVISAVRTIRAERDIAPSRALPVWLADGTARERRWLERYARYLEVVGRMASVNWLEAGAAAPESAMKLVGDTKVLVPLGAFIDKQAELERLAREIGKIEKELAKLGERLKNPRFVERAPREVVEQERRRAGELETALAKLAAQREQVRALPD